MPGFCEWRATIAELIEIVETLVRPRLPEPYVLYAVEWERRGTDWVLSVLVDKTGGIEIDETAALSELISPILDGIRPDPFPAEGYMLEVASPGAERPLKKPEDFENALGEWVAVSLYQKLDGEKDFQGELLQFDGQQLTLEIPVKAQTKHVIIPVAAVAKAQTLVKFP